MYSKPLIQYINNSSQLINVIFPDRLEFSQNISEEAVNVYNETIDGRLQLDYIGKKYIIEITMKAIDEFSSHWYFFNEFRKHILNGGKFDYYPHGNDFPPINLPKAFLNCIIKEPAIENNRTEKISGRWGYTIVFQTNEILEY